MAIVQNPLIARTSGSVANSTFSKWKNKNTLRSKSINPYPTPSSPQVASRAIFKNCSECCMQLSDLFPIMSYETSKSLSPLNFFIKQNRNLFSPDANIIPQANVLNIKLTRGSLIAPLYLTASRDGSVYVTINVYHCLFAFFDQSPSLLCGLVFDFDKKLWYFLVTQNSSISQISVPIPLDSQSNTLFAFGFLYNSVSRKLSISVSGIVPMI